MSEVHVNDGEISFDGVPAMIAAHTVRHLGLELTPLPVLDPNDDEQRHLMYLAVADRVTRVLEVAVASLEGQSEALQTAKAALDRVRADYGFAVLTGIEFERLLEGGE